MKTATSTSDRPRGWITFLETLKDYVDDMRQSMDEIYQYQFSTPEDFNWDGGTQAEKNVALRNHYHKKWKDACEGECQATKEAIARQYIVDFGGIRRNSPEKISHYATASETELANGQLAGVASWSKVLSIRDPLTYAIYDARVAFSLNALQEQKHGKVGVWFPLLSTQNVTLKRVQTRFSHIKPKPDHRIKPRQAYRYYMEALMHAVGKKRPDDGEMILFAVAPALARDWEHANPLN